MSFPSVRTIGGSSIIIEVEYRLMPEPTKALRIRICHSKIASQLRVKTQSTEQSHVVVKSRDFCKKIIDLGRKLKETSKRYESQIRQSMPPQMVCQLQLYFLIHEGPFSKVYKVRDKQEGGHYALKKIEISPDRQNREQKMLKNLKSSFLASVIDVYWGPQHEKTKELNVLMKLYSYNLEDFLATRPQLQDLDIKILVYQMARSIHYVHSKGICHRDVKPSNFLFDRNGRVYLSDFGSAKYIKKDQKSICYIGGRGYRAPELLLGHQEYSHSIDIWSFGCILLEMLTGKQVFNGSSNIDCLLNIARYFGSKQLKRIKGDEGMTCLVPSLKGIGIDTLLPSCDPQLKDLLCSMLRVDSAKRIKPLDILIHPFLDDLRDEQVFYSIMKQKFDISDFFIFSPVQLKNNEQYYTKLIPIWKRDRPEKRTSNGR